MGSCGFARLLAVPLLGRKDADVGCTDGVMLDAVAAISGSRGSKLGLSSSFTTTAISMGSSSAEPAARGPVTVTLVGSSGARSFSACT